MNNTYLILPNLIRWSHAACANVDNENIEKIQSTTELGNTILPLPRGTMEFRKSFVLKFKILFDILLRQIQCRM